MFTNPLSYAGYPPGVTGTPTTQNSTVRAATVDEANDGVLDNVYISPVTAQAATSLDFASPPVLGYGSTTPRPVASTTLSSTLNTTLATAVTATSATIANAANTGALTVQIANGASGANAEVDILSGVGTAGAGTLKMANNTRVTTIDLGNIAPAAARTTTILGGNSAQNDTLNILNGAPSANTQTVSILSGTATGGTQALNLGNGIGGSLTVSMANGVNTTSQTVNISNGASAGDSTVNILSGVGTAGAGVLSMAGNTRVTTIGLGNVAPAAARTTTILGGSQAQDDTLNILNGTPSAGTQTLNIFTAAASGGTQAFNLFGTGATRAGTIRIGTGAAVHDIGIGSSTAKLGFFGATTVVQPVNTTDLRTAIIDLGLLASGGATPLNLNGGALTAASAALTTSGATIGVSSNTAAGTGVAGEFTSSAATISAVNCVTGSIQVPATAVSGATPVVNNVRTGQVGFTNVVANGAYETLTLTDSLITAASVIIASASCTTVSSAVQIVEITPGSGSVAFRVFNAGSASTGANVLINFWVLN